MKRNPTGGAASAQSRWKTQLHSLGRMLASWHFRLCQAGRSFDLYHEPNTIPLPCNRPTVATVHDLSVLRHPHWHPADRVAFFEQHFVRGLERCAHILSVSEFTRQELIRHFNVPGDKVTVTYNGIRAGLRPLTETEIAAARKRLGLPEQYLLHVGTLEPRKNLLMLLRAYVALPASLRAKWPLVLAGGWGWNVAELADYYHGTARAAGVLHLGYVGDGDLPALYNGARALVFPTHYEGFGLPPVEMLACGGAVLASTAGAVAEVLGPAACLIDPNDQATWTESMRRIATDDEWRASLRNGAAERVRVYTWERCAAQTWRVFRAAARGERAPTRIAA